MASHLCLPRRLPNRLHSVRGLLRSVHRLTGMPNKHIYLSLLRQVANNQAPSPVSPRPSPTHQRSRPRIDPTQVLERLRSASESSLILDRPPSHLLASAITAFGRSGRLDLATQVLDTAEHYLRTVRDLCQSSRPYSALMLALVQSGDYLGAMNVFRRGSAIIGLLDHRCHDLLVEAAGRAGDVALALSTVERMRSSVSVATPTTATYNRLLDACVRNGDVAATRHAARLLTSDPSARPNGTTVSLLLSAAESESEVERVLAWAGLPWGLTAHRAVAALLRIGMPDRATVLLDTVLRQYGPGGGHAQSVLSEAYRQVLRHFLLAGDHDAALNTWFALRRGSLHVPASTLSLLLLSSARHVAASHRPVHAQLRALVGPSEPPVVSLGPAIQAAASVGDVTSLLLLLRDVTHRLSLPWTSPDRRPLMSALSLALKHLAYANEHTASLPFLEDALPVLSRTQREEAVCAFLRGTRAAQGVSPCVRAISSLIRLGQLPSKILRDELVRLSLRLASSKAGTLDATTAQLAVSSSLRAAARLFSQPSPSSSPSFAMYTSTEARAPTYSLHSHTRLDTEGEGAEGRVGAEGGVGVESGAFQNILATAPTLPHGDTSMSSTPKDSRTTTPTSATGTARATHPTSTTTTTNTNINTNGDSTGNPSNRGGSSILTTPGKGSAHFALSALAAAADRHSQRAQAAGHTAGQTQSNRAYSDSEHSRQRAAVAAAVEEVARLQSSWTPGSPAAALALFSLAAHASVLARSS